MISTLDELQRYTEERAERSPAIASRVLLRSPGLGAEDAARLARDLPGLPQSYLDVAQRFALASVELGMAGLRPRDLGGDGLADRLVVANGPDNPVVGFLRDNDLYEVASWETDPIAVVREGAERRPGEVVWVDITSAPSYSVSPLAADFATFMLLAGRIYQAGHIGAGVDEVLDGLPVDEQQAESWHALGSMVLD